MRDKDTKTLEALYENVNGGPGKIFVAKWQSHTDSNITHILSYNPDSNTFIDISKDIKGMVIERKEIDGAELEKYAEWYDSKLLNKMNIMATKNQEYNKENRPRSVGAGGL